MSLFCSTDFKNELNQAKERCFECGRFVACNQFTELRLFATNTSNKRFQDLR